MCFLCKQANTYQPRNFIHNQMIINSHAMAEMEFAAFCNATLTKENMPSLDDKGHYAVT